MPDHVTVEELRARGWTIPDGLTFGDLDGHVQHAPRQLDDARRYQLCGRNLDELRWDEHWARGDERAVRERATVIDNAAMVEHWALIGVSAPETIDA